MVKIPQFHCREHRFDPLVGELRSHMPCSYVAKKKKKRLDFSKALSSFPKLSDSEMAFRSLEP